MRKEKPRKNPVKQMGKENWKKRYAFWPHQIKQVWMEYARDQTA